MTTKAPKKSRMILAAALLSGLAHAGLLASPIASALVKSRGAEVRPPLLQHAHLGERAARAALPVILAAERRELVARARADLAAGRLELGAFILATNDIDAREQGQPFDLARAKTLYAARVAALRTALLDEESSARAVMPEVFGDLHYVGRAGGRMGDALVEGGGSCEPLSHLIAAAMFDSGHPEGASLRFYGGDSGGGATHLTPVLVDGESEFDLLTGGAALKAGVRFSATDLIEVYARAHGLAPALSGAGAGAGAGAGTGTGTGTGADEAPSEPAPPPPSSLAAGYPPNHDGYPGVVPLYATHAVQAAREEGAPPLLEPREQADECAFFVRMAVLDPPTLARDAADPSGASVELHRLPTSAQIDRTFSVIRAVEEVSAGPQADTAERLMGLACLAAMYDRAAVDLTFVSELSLARVAADKRAKAASEGEALIARIDWAGREGEQVLKRLGDRFSGRNWLLLVLKGGDAPVLRLVQRGKKDDWGRINALAALAVDPATRAKAFELLDALSMNEQVDVMHEVFHAHDHLRPWASNYALEVADGALPGRAFSRAYRVFRGLAWGLWEGARPPEEVLSSMVVEARRAQLGRAWEESFVEYYGRNALSLHTHRPDADAHAAALKRWLEREGYTDLDLYRTRLVER